MNSISAQRHIAAPPERVFSFLADLESHWRLAGRWIEVEALEGPPGRRSGGRVRLRGPFGVGRTAETRITEISEGECVAGTAVMGGTRGRVCWKLTPEASGTLVCLEATIDELEAGDAMLLHLGGRQWLSSRFGNTLVALEREMASAP